MLYISYMNLDRECTVGIKKKIKAQCRAFEKAFGSVYYTSFSGHTIYLLSKDEIVEKEFALTKKMCNDIVLEWLKKYEINKTYIRYDYSDIWFLDFLNELRKRCIKVVLEFPTIPYDGERGSCRPIEDRYYREQLCHYVDCCTTYANYKEVFNIPCIPLTNGVDLEEHRAKRYREKDGSIILVAVATMVRWHGYERVIEGMHEYYSNGGEKNVIFNLVGNGGQVSYYKRIVDTYHLNKNVVFHGVLEGNKLDEIYDNSDIAIGSLALYKIGIKSLAPIKLREYCARGIPLIYGYDDISFSDDDYFVYRVPNDSSMIDVNGIVDFYNKMYDGRDFVKDMRQYSALHLTWETILQPVIKYMT